MKASFYVIALFGLFLTSSQAPQVLRSTSSVKKLPSTDLVSDCSGQLEKTIIPRGKGALSELSFKEQLYLEKLKTFFPGVIAEGEALNIPAYEIAFSNENVLITSSEKKLKIQLDEKSLHLKVAAGDKMNIDLHVRKREDDFMSWLGFNISPTLQQSTFEEIEAAERVLVGALFRLDEAEGGQELAAILASELRKIDSLRTVYRGEVNSIPLSILADSFLNLTFPKYYIGPGARYQVVRFLEDNKVNHIDTLFFDVSRMHPQHKYTRRQVFLNFILSLEKSLIARENSPYAIRNLMYVDDEQVRFSFHAINFAALARKRDIQHAGYEKIGFMIRQFIAQQYSDRLKVPKDILEETLQVSEQVEERSLSIISTREGSFGFEFLRDYTEDGKIIVEYLQTQPTQAFTINGAITAVYSRSEQEKLPLEIFTGKLLKRKFPSETLVEIGRFSVDKEVEEFDPMELAVAMSALARKVKGVDRLIVETDVVRRRYFSQFGFTVIDQQTARYNGRPEYIMEADPDTFYQLVLEKIYSLD